MGRKKKKVEKPWCWYCNREFDDEKILIQHQKAKHFKCTICNKKLFTGPGLAIHCMQVHKETIDKIPGAVQGRDSIDVEVYGMEGIPQAYEGDSTSEPKSKKPAVAPAPIPIVSAPFPGFSSIPPMPIPTPSMMPAPYVTGQFFGARQPLTFPSTLQFPGMSTAVTMNTGAIPMPRIPIQMPASYQSFQQPTMPASLPSVEPPTLNTIPIPQSQPSTSAQAPPPSVQSLLGSKTRTRIVVPDESISLEENMANRLALLSQVRYH